MTFDGSAIDGFSRVQESDVLARPDAEDLPDPPGQGRRGADGPGVLRRRQPRRHPVRGRPPQRPASGPSSGPGSGASRFYAAPEVEYFYFAGVRPVGPAGPPRPGLVLRAHGQRPARPTCARSTVLTLEDMGIPVEYSQHEDAPASTRSTCATPTPSPWPTRHDGAADGQGDRPAARGAYATFMPKPIAGVQGSGMHTHFSLFEGDANAFHDPGDEHGLSQGGEGLHRRPARATRRRSPPSPTSGSTPTSGWWSATRRRCTWRGPATTARPSSTCPHAKRNKSESTRIEYRAPDPACNPYLAFALVLAAGLKGIEEGYELPPPEPRPTSTT